MSAQAPVPSRVRPDLPHALDVVIARGMAKDPRERFASAGALARACARAVGIAESEAPEVAARPVREPSPPTGSAPTIVSE